MLSDASFDRILQRLPELTIGVLGDLFLDRYLDIDADLTEPSLETGLDAYQVTRVRSYPGAAGTVINNLAALGVKEVVAISVIGDDGEGHELRQALANLKSVNATLVYSLADASFRTPTYTKPMLCAAGAPPRELKRLDIKNRSTLPLVAEAQVLLALATHWPRLDALVVLDQVSEENCGVITDRISGRLAELGEANPERLILADSRHRIGLFRFVTLKPNARECLRAMALPEEERALPQAAWRLANRTCRPVFCTAGELGILLTEPGTCLRAPLYIPAYAVRGPVDIVGAGDSTSAGIACAFASGATLAEAAAFGNLVASITIQQIGTTGTASPEQLRARWQAARSD